MRDGITYLFADRGLALVMAAAFASLLFMTASAPAEVFFAKDVLHTGDAGLLHDIGKLGVSNAILDKPGRLTEAEYEVIKEHPRNTEEILLRVPIFSGLAVPAAAHHERVDGRGYHRGIAGDAIPAMSRVLACADVFDALTAKRPYRDPMSTDDALALMGRDVGAAFFPEPFAALCAHVDAQPLAA